MHLSGRPLLDNTGDQRLFVGRQGELERIELSLRSGLNCLLVGDPGSGKTSLVRAVMYRSHEAGGATGFSYVRANAARTAADLLVAVLEAVRPGPAEFSPGRQRTPVELVDDLIGEFAESKADRVGRVVVVEDVSTVVGAEVFGALRDELWQVDARWLVTTSTAQAAGLLRPPADVFFETRIELGPLTATEAAELLRRRLDETESAAGADLVEAAANSAPLSPRRLLEVARELAADQAVGGAGFTWLTGLQARSTVLEQSSRPARMLAKELEDLGWASASDRELLDRMGWTRPRVVQVLAELEGRGLVEMREVSTGRGRPRKLYRLVPAARFADPRPPGQPT
jgi:energy-coupling factor transporter ATP-binding protein EcfA2